MNLNETGNTSANSDITDDPLEEKGIHLTFVDEAKEPKSRMDTASTDTKTKTADICVKRSHELPTSGIIDIDIPLIGNIVDFNDIHKQIIDSFEISDNFHTTSISSDESPLKNRLKTSSTLSKDELELHKIISESGMSIIPGKDFENVFYDDIAKTIDATFGAERKLHTETVHSHDIDEVTQSSTTECVQNVNLVESTDTGLAHVSQTTELFHNIQSDHHEPNHPKSRENHEANQHCQLVCPQSIEDAQENNPPVIPTIVENIKSEHTEARDDDKKITDNSSVLSKIQTESQGSDLEQNKCNSSKSIDTKPRRSERNIRKPTKSIDNDSDAILKMKYPNYMYKDIANFSLPPRPFLGFQNMKKYSSEFDEQNDDKNRHQHSNKTSEIKTEMKNIDADLTPSMTMKYPSYMYEDIDDNFTLPPRPLLGRQVLKGYGNTSELIAKIMEVFREAEQCEEFESSFHEINIHTENKTYRTNECNNNLPPSTATNMYEDIVGFTSPIQPSPGLRKTAKLRKRKVSKPSNRGWKGAVSVKHRKPGGKRDGKHGKGKGQEGRKYDKPGRPKTSNYDGTKHFGCHYCNKFFVQRGTLRNHIRIHTGEKPFSCRICGKNFSLKLYLVSHERIHTGEKPYKCETCGRSFSQPTSLKTHMQTQHSNQKPFKCGTCGLSFAAKIYLTSHRKSHEN